MRSLIAALITTAMFFGVRSSASADDFDSAGVKIHYTVQGQGDPVILIHGCLPARHGQTRHHRSGAKSDSRPGDSHRRRSRSVPPALCGTVIARAAGLAGSRHRRRRPLELRGATGFQGSTQGGLGRPVIGGTKWQEAIAVGRFVRETEWLAPTAQHPSAQGNALGIGRQKTLRPEGPR
jgi:hypothetical protein